MKTLEELQELAAKMNYTLEELMYEMLCDSVDDLEQKDKEIARLNKIIDELEKYLIFKKDNAYELENPKKSKLKPYGIEKDMYHISYCRYYEILDKLKELKEGGKE